MLPFGFAGELLLPVLTSSQTSILRDRIIEALHSEGARNMLVSERRIMFAGLTDTRTLRPLVNIQACEIRIEEKTVSTHVSYMCSVERWPIFGAILISLAFAVLTISGSPVAYHAGVFALFVLILFIGNSLLVRRRFRRWLTGIVLSY